MQVLSYRGCCVVVSGFIALLLSNTLFVAEFSKNSINITDFWQIIYVSVSGRVLLINIFVLVSFILLL